jgi:hypothetical protein
VALAIDASTPAIAVQATGATATVTTASFTPPAGSLLVIQYAANTIDPTSPATPTITDSLGTPLTYTLQDFSARADTPAADGQAATWTAPVASSTAMTVTVTNQAASPNRHAALRVRVLTGQHASPVGAHGKSGSISASSIAQNYTAQATGGWGFIGVIDWSATGAMTAGTGCTVEGSANVGAPDITYGFARRTSADDVNGNTNTLNVTLGGASTSVRWTYIEILPDVASIPYAPPRSAVTRDPGEAWWIQKDRRDANLVATAANPLTTPLDSAWQAGGRYWHLYNDAVRPGWQPQQRVASDPSLLAPVAAAVLPATVRTVQTRDSGEAQWIQRRSTDATLLASAELENELLGGADTLKRYLEPATHGPHWWMPEQKPVGAAIDAVAGGAIAFDTTGSTSMTAGATSTNVDISAAAVGAWCYCWVALGINSGAVSATGWTSLLDADEGAAAHYALLRRQKQGGDTTFSFGWTTSTKGTLTWASWTGLDSATPDEGAALATNGVTSRTAVPTPTATPTAADRWAVGFFANRTTNVANKPITYTPDAAQTERIDVDNNAAGSAPWVGTEIADTNSAVTQAAHSYTAAHNVAESHDGSAILFLIPGAAAPATSVPFNPQRTVQIRDLGDVQWLQRRANLQLTDALLENELLGGAGTAQRANTPASNAPRWWMPEQPKRDGTTPGLLDSALLENELLGSGTTAERAGTAASNAPRTWTPLQPKRDASTPGLLDTAQLEAPLLGVDRHAIWYTDRRAQPPQRSALAPVDAPIVIDPLTVAFGAGGNLWHLYNTATDQVSRAWFPKQRTYLSDPSFYPTVAPTDPLTLAFGAGGTYWLLYNVAAVTVDRREVPQQRLYISDPSLLLTALLEIPPTRAQGPMTDRRYPLSQARALSQPDVADVPAADPRARLVPTTNADRRSLIVQPARQTFYFDAGPGTPPLTLAWGAGGSYWHRYNDWRRERTWTQPTGSVGILCACHVTRPDTGITTRPSSGTTAYLLTMTTRPATGNTVRPDTGITADPCC